MSEPFRSVKLWTVLLAAACLIAAGRGIAAPDDNAEHQAQIEARILWPPQTVPGSDGKRHLGYEIHVTNFNSGAVTLESLAIFAGRDARPLTTIRGAALNALLAHPVDDGRAAKGITIAAGAQRTLFVWLTLPDGVAPASLRHVMDLRTGDGALQRADGMTTIVAGGAPIRLAPPLRGGRWLATEGPGMPQSHHWGSLVAVNGRLTIPQRFAIDWFGLDQADHSLRSKHESLAATTDRDWVGYDSEVLAVADGVVRDVPNDAPDGTPLAPLAEPDDLTARTLYGNFVVLEIAPGVFAHYAHLRKGSVIVRIGQRIRRGTVIGHLGQSGSAGAPHLHFQLSNRATFEESEGLPFTIDAFALLGKTRIEATFDNAEPVSLGKAPVVERREAMPLDGDVVRFR